MCEIGELLLFKHSCYRPEIPHSSVVPVNWEGDGTLQQEPTRALQKKNLEKIENIANTVGIRVVFISILFPLVYPLDKQEL